MKQAQKLVKQADKARKAKDNEKAMSLLNSAISLDPENKKAKEQKVKVEEKLAQEKKQNEYNAKINTMIEKGKKKLDDNEYENSTIIFNQVLELEPDRKE